MKKNSNIIIRIDGRLKKEFYDLVESNGYYASEVLLACVHDMCKSNKIPLRLTPYLKYREKSKLSIPEIKKVLQEIIESSYKDKIEKAYLFGSYSRGEENSNSDIDIRLITKGEFSLFDLSTLYELMKEKLNKEIDIVTSGNLDISFLENIKKEEICIYE